MPGPEDFSHGGLLTSGLFSGVLDAKLSEGSIVLFDSHGCLDVLLFLFLLRKRVSRLLIHVHNLSKSLPLKK